MAYVYSTLTADNTYVIYAKGGADLKVREHAITIKGGTGLADKRFITPLGVATQVSDEDLKLLEANEVFKLHKDNGFIVVQESNKQEDHEKVASDMVTRDESSPVTPSDFEVDDDPDSTVIKVTTNTRNTNKRNKR